jgi:predicted MPP superfamily phosphohydrolase
MRIGAGLRVAGAVLAVALVLPLWGFVLEPASLRNEDYELAPPGWTEACDGIRVAVLADLHVGSPFNGLDKLARIVELTRAAQPDLVLLAGDYVIHDVIGGSFTPPEEFAAAFRGFPAPLGVWAVLGNHDWWYDAPRVRRALEDVGIPVLEDQARRIESGACAFWLAGVGDFWEGRHDVHAALAEVTDSTPVLLFTHNPDLFPEIPARVSLTIAGHTHGGQVYLPGLGRLVVPSRYGERYAIGHAVEDGRHLFVSAGLGTSILPVRFLVPPEVSVVTLRSATSSAASVR